MRVLVACEFSGIVRDAFLSKGHDAVSCDIIPTESIHADDSHHYQGDVRDILDQGWDLMIAHPPCTYLANSGARWLWEENGKRDLNVERFHLMKEAAAFFNLLLEANIPRICVENPVMHKMARLYVDTPYTQKIEPWQFGHPEKKGTCLWLKNLPPLKPTIVIPEHLRTDVIHKMPDSKSRAKNRSRTFTGIAAAMADQWEKWV